MKRLGLLVFLLPLLGCPTPKPGQPLPNMLVLTWTGNGNPALPPCSTTVQTSCLSGYVAKDANGNVIATPALAASSYTQTITAVPTATYTLTVSGIDPKGNVVVSPPATATAQ